MDLSRTRLPIFPAIAGLTWLLLAACRRLEGLAEASLRLACDGIPPGGVELCLGSLRETIWVTG